MATENKNPQNAKPVGGRKPQNPDAQAGQASQGIGNVAGQKAAQQQGSSGTADQGGKSGKIGLDQKGGPLPENRGSSATQVGQRTIEAQED